MSSVLPLYMKDFFGYEVGLVLMTVIGFCFGFVLERAGFGRAHNIVAQFYLTNMRVLKVMFTAVGTAGIGLAALHGLGVLDLSLVTTPPSFFWAAAVGGVLVGVGMTVSGYCPGTSVVAAASGNLDGAAALGGMAIGSVLFGFAYPLVEGLYMARPLQEIHLPELLGLPRAVLAAAVLVVAALAFLGGEKVERIVAKRDKTEPPDVAPALRNRVFGVFAGLAAVGLVIMGLVSEPEVDRAPPPATKRISSLELASLMVQDPTSLQLVDLRSPRACRVRTIPGALCRPEGKGAGFLGGLPPTRQLVLFGAREVKAPRAVSSFDGPVAVLAGGFSDFNRQILRKPAPPAAPDARTLRDYRLRTALFGHFTGARVKAAPVTIKPVLVKRKIKKGGGC